jgi:hypothetical protein
MQDTRNGSLIQDAAYVPEPDQVRWYDFPLNRKTEQDEPAHDSIGCREAKHRDSRRKEGPSGKSLAAV